MNKKSVLALAVGAACASPVLAQESTVQIYGRAYPAFQTFKASGATAPGAIPSNLVDPAMASGDFDRRNAVNAYNTRVGFRGREQLGGGMSAIWQIEQRVQIDTGAAGNWASRDSFVGLRGGFGTVRFGHFDTVYKNYGAVVGALGISSGNIQSHASILNASGLGTESLEVGDAGFHIRAPNSVHYETPSFGGFQAGIQYSPDEAKGNPGREGLDSNLWSVGVKYEAGPLYVSVQHERHNDWLELSGEDAGTGIASPFSGLTTESSDTATRLSVRYRISSAHRISADIARMEWDESGPGFGLNYDKMSWDIGWEARWGGPVRTVLMYGRANEGDCEVTGIACTTDGLDGSQVSLTVAYDFSKRTFVYGGFARVSMGESAVYDNWTNGTPPRGSDATQMQLGVAHSF
jgi:predicted porin